MLVTVLQHLPSTVSYLVYVLECTVINPRTERFSNQPTVRQLSEMEGSIRHASLCSRFSVYWSQSPLFPCTHKLFPSPLLNSLPVICTSKQLIYDLQNSGKQTTIIATTRTSKLWRVVRKKKKKKPNQQKKASLGRDIRLGSHRGRWKILTYF